MPAAVRDLEHASALSGRDFERFSSLAKEKFGLDLRRGKEELVAGRLRKKMKELNLSSFAAYYEHVIHDSSGEALVALIDSLATNHTSFLREAAHFEFLRNQILPAFQAGSRLRVWSAACSSGEEPYSIAVTLLEALGTAAFQRTGILATDISSKVLQSAAQGIYSAERLQTVPADWHRKYFLRGEKQWQGFLRVRPEVGRMVEFRRVNLVESLPQLGLFHVIFCRNVMIYFDNATQELLVNRLAACLEPGGYLFVGHAESLTGIAHPLDYVKPAIYRKRSAGR